MRAPRRAREALFFYQIGRLAYGSARLMRSPRGTALAVALVALGPAASCSLTAGINADRVLVLYNAGATDSLPDASLSPDEIAEERVALTARRYLIRGYFTQGPGTACPCASRWLASPRIQSILEEAILAQRTSIAGDASAVAQAGRSPSRATDQTAPELGARLFAYLRTTSDPADALAPGPLCEGGAPTRAARSHLDAARLAAALELVALEVARMIDEQIVTSAQASRGLRRALVEASEYVADRRWRPSEGAATLGISIKGGASSGVYSAGAVWRALTLLQRYREHKRAGGPGALSAEDARFAVASGTSAGAIIAAAVDLFHQETCIVDRDAERYLGVLGRPRGRPSSETGARCQEYARRLLATLFTCTDQYALYCVDSRPVFDLAGSQQGMMDFDKLRQLLLRHVGGHALVNETELVLTTVDFRWGELYVQSDQDPSTVSPTGAGMPSAASLRELHASIEASFVLPFIAWPTQELRIGGARRSGVFLDGGIKSEIPLLPLGQRGVERALVVGSSPPRITPTEPQRSAAEIAARYLDVSLSAVTEGEWTAAVPTMRRVEAFERAACATLMDGTPDVELSKLCRGDLAGACGGDGASRQFEVMGIFRREDVDPTYGYTFDPEQMRRLFNAGTEAARARCFELARFLGMGDVPRENLDAWCNETPKAEPGLCRDRPEAYRTCERTRRPGTPP